MKFKFSKKISVFIRFHGNRSHFENFFPWRHFYSWWVTILWSFIEFGWAVSEKLRGQFHWRRRSKIIIIRNGGKTISLPKTSFGRLNNKKRSKHYKSPQTSFGKLKYYVKTSNIIIEQMGNYFISDQKFLWIYLKLFLLNFVRHG